DAYSGGQPAAADAGGASPVSAEPPVVPAKLSDSVHGQCAKCLLENCPTERRACLASPRCRALLTCQAECSDPSCIENCRSDVPASPVFEDYFACAFNTTFWNPISSRCQKECAAGDDWDCV